VARAGEPGGAMILAIVLYAFGLFMIAVCAGWIRQSWSNTGNALHADSPRMIWSGNLATWRAHVRWTACCGPLALILATVAVMIAGTGASGDAFQLAMLALLLPVVLLVFVASPAISLLNKPKWLVPPHLRHQPGRIAEALGEPVRLTPPPVRRGARGAPPIDEM